MIDFRRYWFDLSAAAGLPVALLFVFLIDGCNKPNSSVRGDTLHVEIVQDGSRHAKKELKLGVVPTQVGKNTQTGESFLWDDMGKLLKDMGKGYDHFDVVTEETVERDPRKLAEYDVLFLTCKGGGEAMSRNLRDFVEEGGTLYASDWRFDVIERAFGEYVDPALKGSGTKQVVNATVDDSGLKEIIGPTVLLEFDLPEWKTAAFRKERVEVLIHGTFQKQLFPKDPIGAPFSAPLLARFQPRGGKGTVIFTSFHNEKINSDTATKLLQYLVFRMVTAGVDADIQKMNKESGFPKQTSNLLSAPKNNQSVTRSFKSEKKGTLRFCLGFRNEGATMKLRIQSPEGKSYTWEGNSTVIIDVPSASAGEWTSTITAVDLPYPTFPFTFLVIPKQ